MVFSSVIFLLCFLPIVLLIYFLLPSIKLKNFFLLLASLLFYTWGEHQYVLVMLFSISATWGFGHLIATMKEPSQQKLLLIIGLSVHLSVLLFFKYADFFADNIIFAVTYLDILPSISGGSSTRIHLPIGISFFTFQAMSYLIDVYRNKSVYQKNPLTIAMYKSFFPQLIAGPIVRYVDIKNEITHRRVTIDSFSTGVERFIIGLAQKVLIANIMGSMADQVFNSPADQLTPAISWLGVIAYTLQIYYDFSGYSSMAIGLAKMFGFDFLENFNFPYTAVSITDFWRRWHISLSSWFRDYLYIPLGGSRGSKMRTYLNLFIVFALCGFWHGASWTFLFWGLFHGIFLVLEKAFLLSLLRKLPLSFSRMYTIFIIMTGWVFFRSESISGAVNIIKRMFGLGSAKPEDLLSLYDVFTYERMATMFSGIMFSFLFVNVYRKDALHIEFRKMQFLYPYAKVTVLTAVFGLTIVYLAGNTFNPFIYFRF